MLDHPVGTVGAAQEHVASQMDGSDADDDEDAQPGSQEPVRQVIILRIHICVGCSDA